MTSETILIVVAHPDDEILGFGGTGASLANSGITVQPIILCGSVVSRFQRPEDHELMADISKASETVGFAPPVLGPFPNLRMNNVDHLDIVQYIEQQILQFEPTKIFTHHPGDLNDDHRQIALGCQAAARFFQRRTSIAALKALYYMEILSATDWSFSNAASAFAPTSYYEIGDNINLKISALSHYRNVMRDFPHPRSSEVLRGLAAYRGGQSGLMYAEAFQLAFSTQL